MCEGLESWHSILGMLLHLNDKLNHNRKEIWVRISWTDDYNVMMRTEMQWWQLRIESDNDIMSSSYKWDSVANKKLSSISFQISKVTNYQLDICWWWPCRTGELIDLKLMSFIIESPVMNCKVQLAFTMEDQPSIHAKSFLCLLCPL